MGIATDLGYAPTPPGAARRLVHAVASTRRGARLLARVLPPLDRRVAALTGGRTTLCSLISGLPVLIVTTTGRRSGRARSVPLVGVPVRGTVALLGTSFGADRTPAWALNLVADPRAVVTHRDRTIALVAREADEAERAEVLAVAPDLYVGYARYLERITERTVPILVLERASGEGG